MKKTKRSKNKYPALEKNLNLKIRQELIDYDYLDKLSEEEKEWLNKFSEEYINGSFTKNKKGKYSKNLHKTKKLRNECWQRNNFRNNDILGKSKIHNMLKDIDSTQAIVEAKHNNQTASLNRRYDY